MRPTMTVFKITLIVIAACLALGIGRYLLLSEQAPSGQDRQVEQLAQQREALNRTVWANEVTAQQYERVFVRLWDELRSTEDKFAVLASLPFERFSCGTAGQAGEFSLGIRRTRYEAPDQGERTWSHPQFVDQLDRLRASGYTIVETEWHHSKFVPDTNGPPRSVVSTALHLQQELAGPAQRRWIVRADLEIEWAASKEEHGHPAIESIRAQNVRVLQREGRAGFERVLRAAGKSGDFLSAHPILVYDLDGDGLSEIVLPRWNRVYWNLRRGGFREDDLLAHPVRLWEAGILADLTGDGVPDLFSVSKKGAAVLFAGSDGGRFLTAGQPCADVPFTLPSGITAGDIDGDGDLDLWVTQYKLSYEGGQMPTPYYDANDGFPSYLLINKGDGTFHDRTAEAGLADKRFRRSYSASLVDMDDDNDLDLMVVSDYAGLDLYENNGRGRFTDVTPQWVGPRHSFGMGHTFGDYNLDGQLDFYVIGMSSTTARRLDQMKLGPDERQDITQMRAEMGYGNRMYVRSGNHYETPQFAASVARTGWSWGTTSADFDNDGDRDIYVANGHRSGDSTQDYCTSYWCHDIYTGDSQENEVVQSLFEQSSLRELYQGKISWNGYEKNVLLLNDGGKDFVNVAFLLGTSFVYDSRAVVSDDLDGDGNVDLLVAEYTYLQKGIELHLNVYRNTIETDNHWIGVRMSEAAGVSPIGARIALTTSAGKQVARMVTGDSFLSQHANTVHFGLGQVDTVNAIEITWPNGKRKRIENPAVDRYHDIRPVVAADL